LLDMRGYAANGMAGENCRRSFVREAPDHAET
jgi:ribosomal protein L40E